MALIRHFFTFDDPLIERDVWDFESALTSSGIHLGGLVEKDNATGYEMDINLGNFPSEKVQCEFDDETRMLCIKGEHTATTDEKKNGRAWSETKTAFERSVKLPETIDASNIHSKMIEGTMHVDMPLTKAALEEAKRAKTKSIAQPPKKKLRPITIQHN